MKLQTLKEAKAKAEKLAKSIENDPGLPKDVTIPKINCLHRWSNRDIISSCKRQEWSDEYGATVGLWSNLLHFEIATTAYLKGIYSLEKMVKTAKATRRPLELTGGMTGDGYVKGFWSDRDLSKRAFEDYLDRELSEMEFLNLIKKDNPPRPEIRLIMDYLETWDFWEGRWSVIRDMELEKV